MKNLIKILFINFLVFNISCDSKKKAIDDLLRSEINNYMEFSEVNGTGIYWVEFNNEGNSFIILESSYYNKKDLDGYIQIGDNKVFFYYSNKNFVNVNTLSKADLDDIPDENSEISNIDFDSYVWEYSINKDGSIKKISDNYN